MKKEEILTNYLSDKVCDTCDYFSTTFENCRLKKRKVNTCKKWKEITYVNRLDLRELNRLLLLVNDKIKKEKEEEKNENFIYNNDFNSNSGITNESIDEINREKL